MSTSSNLLPTSNISLSNVCVAMIPNSTPPYSMAALVSNVRALTVWSITTSNASNPTANGADIASFRGVTPTPTVPAAGLTLDIQFGGPTVPSTANVGGSLTASTPNPPLMVLDPVRGYVAEFGDRSNASRARFLTTAVLVPQSYSKLCWIKPTTLTQGAGHIMSSRTTSAATRHYMYFNSTLRVHAGHGNPTTGRVIDPTTLNPDAWTHIAVTYENATNRMMLYRNGQLVQSVVVAALAWSGGVAVQTGALAGGSSCRALMDSVRIYGRALTPAEVLDAYYFDGGV
jgi:hypothetical protein